MLSNTGDLFSIALIADFQADCKTELEDPKEEMKALNEREKRLLQSLQRNLRNKERDLSRETKRKREEEVTPHLVSYIFDKSKEKKPRLTDEEREAKEEREKERKKKADEERERRREAKEESKKKKEETIEKRKEKEKKEKEKKEKEKKEKQERKKNRVTLVDAIAFVLREALESSRSEWCHKIESTGPRGLKVAEIKERVKEFSWEWRTHLSGYCSVLETCIRNPDVFVKVSPGEYALKPIQLAAGQTSTSPSQKETKSESIEARARRTS